MPTSRKSALETRESSKSERLESKTTNFDAHVANQLQKGIVTLHSTREYSSSQAAAAATGYRLSSLTHS